jgi:hypothetical protein
MYYAKTAEEFGKGTGPDLMQISKATVDRDLKFTKS